MITKTQSKNQRNGRTTLTLMCSYSRLHLKSSLLLLLLHSYFCFCVPVVILFFCFRPSLHCVNTQHMEQMEKKKKVAVAISSK